MLYDLLRRDLSRANLRTPPATDALWEQKLHSMAPEELWWFEKLKDGALLADHDEWLTEVAREALRADFQQHCSQTASAATSTRPRPSWGCSCRRCCRRDTRARGGQAVSGFGNAVIDRMPRRV
jgi:hypothetical protein